MNQKIFPVCVIGGGSAGTMAVLRTVLNNDECLFFPGSPHDKKKSRALWVRKVENMPAHLGYNRGIEEPNAETLKWIAESPFKDNLQIQKNTGVTAVGKDGDFFHLTDSKGGTYLARYIILCTGVMDVQPEIKGSIQTVFDYANAQTIDYCLICDGHHVRGKRTTIIGHGTGAAWAAIMLFERYRSEMRILTNGKPPEFEAEAAGLLRSYGIPVSVAPIAEILGEGKGKVLRGFALEDGSRIGADICFVSLGLIVYNDLARQLGAELDPRGFVKADDAGLTSVPGLYVAGDLKANAKKQIYTAWDQAVNAANAINMKLRASRRPRT
jgi:thioredoxin reductase (NADPH)